MTFGILGNEWVKTLNSECVPSVLCQCCCFSCVHNKIQGSSSYIVDLKHVVWLMMQDNFLYELQAYKATNWFFSILNFLSKTTCVMAQSLQNLSLASGLTNILFFFTRNRIATDFAILNGSQIPDIKMKITHMWVMN